MLFYSRTLPLHDTIWREAMILSDEREVLLHLRAPTDSVRAWLAGIVTMVSTAEGRQRCQRLIDSAEELQDCELIGAWPPTFWMVVFALLAFLEHSESKDLIGGSEAKQAITRLLGKQYDFRAIYETSQNAHRYGLIINGATVLDSLYQLSGIPLNDAGLKCIPQECWTQSVFALHSSKADELRLILEHYDLLYEAMMRRVKEDSLSASASAAFTLHSFASFSKALIGLLDHASDLAQLRAKVLDMCMFIVEDEHESYEEQKRYLERILRADEPPVSKLRRLEAIVGNVRQDVQRDPSEQQKARLVAIIGTISDYYLSQYDLTNAMRFWDMLDEKDWLLRNILSFYRAPERYALEAITSLAGLHLLTILSSRLPASAPLGNIVRNLAGALIVLALAPAVIVLGAIMLRSAMGLRIRQHGLEYVELLMPRLLGAIVVGLSVLALQDTSWQIALQLGWLNLVLICFVAYGLSFAYIFIEVHKTLRPLPLPPHQRTTSFRRSLQASRAIYLIGLQESLIAVLFCSGLFAIGVKPLQELGFGSLAGQGLALLWSTQNGSFVFLPTLVWMWAGLALLIGAFAQLLWQDRRIIAPL